MRVSKLLKAALNVEEFIMGLKLSLGPSRAFPSSQSYIPDKNFEAIHTLTIMYI